MILTVLKIIGIILLIIVGLIVFILGMLLFVPIRYQFEGSLYSELKADAWLKWSPLFLKATVCYKEKKLEYVVKMFGGVVMTNLDIKRSWIGRKFFSFDTEEVEEEAKEDIKSNAVDSKPDEDNEKTDLQNRIQGEELSDTKENEGLNNQTIKQKKGQKKSRKKSQKKKSLSDFIKKKIQSAKEWINNCKIKLKSINKKREQLLKVYHSKRFEVAKEDAKKYLKELLIILKPDKIQGYVHFGMEDPADTGQLLGALAVILPVYDGFLEIQPDFEQKCMEGNLKGCGKIRLFPIVRLALKVMFNKNLIKVTKKVQTIMEN